MSGLYNDLQGFSMPDSIWNQGPLPSGSIVPNSAAQINYGSTLLGDVRPYVYGEPAHVGDQAAVLNTPHKIGKIIPLLQLPDARDGRFSLSHAVDDGDVAFVLRVNRNAGTIQQQNTFDRLELGRIVDPFVNLATVNYLLAGCQRYWNDGAAVHWQQFMVDTDFLPSLSEHRAPFNIRDALRFVNSIATPFGIVHGSEFQGGQTEGSNEPVTYPVNFITTVAISGRVENVVNLWRDTAIDAGSDLVLRLEWLPIAAPAGNLEYVLNHWDKGLARQRFDWVNNGVNMAWQLVPDIFSLDPPHELREDYDWRENGYWHIARCQVMKGAEITYKLSHDTMVQKCYLDDSRLMRGSVLEVNFEPVWVQRVRPRRAVHVDHAAMHVHHAAAAAAPAPVPLVPLRLNAPLVAEGGETVKSIKRKKVTL